MTTRHLRLLAIVVGAIAVAVVLGVAFSILYPRIEIDAGLGLLFALVGLLCAVGVELLLRGMKK